MDFGEKTVSSKTIYEGSLITVKKDVVELQNGEKANRELVDHQPGVGIMAVGEDNKMLFVRQYRKAVERAILEVPAGLVEKDEDWFEAAKREFNEETRYQASHWEKASGFYLSPGYSTEYLQMYWATDLSPVTTALPQDADEHIEVVPLSLAEAEAKVMSGEICDVKTIYALQYWRIRTVGNE